MADLEALYTSRRNKQWNIIFIVLLLIIFAIFSQIPRGGPTAQEGADVRSSNEFKMEVTPGLSGVDVRVVVSLSLEFVDTSGAVFNIFVLEKSNLGNSSTYSEKSILNTDNIGNFEGLTPEGTDATYEIPLRLQPGDYTVIVEMPGSVLPVSIVFDHQMYVLEPYLPYVLVVCLIIGFIAYLSFRKTRNEISVEREASGGDDYLESYMAEMAAMNQMLDFGPTGFTEYGESQEVQEQPQEEQWGW